MTTYMSADILKCCRQIYLCKLLQKDVSIQFAADRCKYTSCGRQIYGYKLLQIYSCIQVTVDIFMSASSCRHIHVYKLLQTYSYIKVAAGMFMYTICYRQMSVAADRWMEIQIYLNVCRPICRNF